MKLIKEQQTEDMYIDIYDSTLTSLDIDFILVTSFGETVGDFKCTISLKSFKAFVASPF